MIHQAAAKFVKAAQADNAGDDERGPDRQRGMWSFLTWSFFIAQAVAAHEALAAGHGAQDASDTDAHGAADDTLTSSGSPATPLVGGVAAEVDQIAAKLAAAAAGVMGPQMWEALQADPAQLKAFIDAIANDAQGSGDVGAIEGDAVAGEPVDVADAAEGAEDATPSVPGIVLPVDVAIDLGLELNANPILGLDLGLDDGISLTLDLGAAPILGLDLNFDGSGPLLSLDLLGIDLGVGGDGGLSTLFGPSGLSLPSLAPVLNAAEPLVELTTSAIDLTGADGLLASGGTIVHSLTAALPLNDLFSQGAHTAYGMELQLSAPLGLPLDLTSGVTADGDGLGALEAAFDSPGDDDAGGLALSSVVESLNLRVLGDGFA